MFYNDLGDNMERKIMHIDVNNAFLSWSALDLLSKGETVDIRTIPALLFSSPPMIAGTVRISTVSPLLNRSKADEDKNALFTSICIIFLSILSPRSL